MMLPTSLCMMLHTRACLALLTCRGPASHYAAYVSALPSEVDCLLLWGGADKKELTGE